MKKEMSVEIVEKSIRAYEQVKFFMTKARDTKQAVVYSPSEDVPLVWRETATIDKGKGEVIIADYTTKHSLFADMDPDIITANDVIAAIHMLARWTTPEDFEQFINNR